REQIKGRSLRDPANHHYSPGPYLLLASSLYGDRLIRWQLQRSNPLADKVHPMSIHNLRAELRHPPRPKLAHSVVKHRSVRIARRDRLRFKDAERSLRRSRADQAGPGQRMLILYVEERRAAAASAVAVAAVDVQVGPRSRFERGGFVVGIGNAIDFPWQLF